MDDLLSAGSVRPLETAPASVSSGPERSAPDQLVHWLLESLKLETTVFHVGQYCGSFRASTAGRALASYHLVLRGRCYVHVAGQAPFQLAAGDGVFFLRDVRHFVSSEPGTTVLGDAPMQPLESGPSDSVGLACGFFHFRGALSELVVGGFPDYLVVRSDSEGLGAIRVLFDLILAEGERPPDRPSPLVARLVDALFFYVMRHVARSGEGSASLWALLRRSEFAALAESILREPAKSWTVASMARVSGMSRASFFKHFVEMSGSSPAQVLLLLRMRIAAQRLASGESAAAAADFVGYQSLAAFSRAFKRVIGERPSDYRRAARA